MQVSRACSDLGLLPAMLPASKSAAIPANGGRLVLLIARKRLKGSPGSKRRAAAQESGSSLQKRYGSSWRNQTFSLAIMNDRFWVDSSRKLLGQATASFAHTTTLDPNTTQLGGWYR
jgi:hypothetical protein